MNDIIIAGNDMVIGRALWLSELGPDYYYFEAHTKKNLGTGN